MADEFYGVQFLKKTPIKHLRFRVTVVHLVTVEPLIVVTFGGQGKLSGRCFRGKLNYKTVGKLLDNET